MQLSKDKKVLVTAGLPYSNGRLHVGHIAGAYLPSDIYVRYLRARGIDTRFICGSDDHGVAIVLSAEKEGKTPAEISSHFNARQKADFEKLGIYFDIYSSTSRNPYHHNASQHFFQVLHDKGYFEKQVTKQFFDEHANMFLPDRFVKGTCEYCGATEQNGDQCENCGKMLDVATLKDPKSARSGKPVTVKDTVHWFLDLSRFEKEVKTWLDSAELRTHTRNYVEGLLSTGLVRRSMTRDLGWGIPLPLKEPEALGKVLYVWFDAPIGYISNTMELCAARDGDVTRYSDWWQSDCTDIVHFIGEDNTIFHCVVWIAMLAAEGEYHLPTAVVVNNFLNFQAAAGGPVEKISKSRGTAVWIEDYIAGGGHPDSLRYYLTTIAPESARTVFNSLDLIQRHNSELVNALGNFVHRVLSFTHKYVGPQVPEVKSECISEADRAFIAMQGDTFTRLTKLLEEFRFKEAQDLVMSVCREGNRYFDQKAPWSTRKTDMEVTKVTLATSIQAIKFLAVTLAPFLPFTSEKIASMLQLSKDDLRWEQATVPPKPGAAISTPEILFAKIE